MGKANITIRDIARHCHVSTATVSRALNHQPGVSEELRLSILRFATISGYEPNSSAQSLRSRNTNIAYLVMREGNSKDLPLHISLLQELKLAVHMDFKIHSLSYDTDLIEDLQRLEERGPARLIIIAGPCLVSDSSRFRSLNSPLLFVLADDAPNGYPSIMSDDFEGAKTLTDAVLDHGHRSIEVITDCDVSGKANYRKPLSGYKTSLAEHDIAFDPSIVHALPVDFNDYLASAQSMVTERLLPVLQHKTSRSHPKPTAILLFSDFMTLPLIRVLWNVGIYVPENISVVSFGGWTLTQYLPVSIWTWVQSVPDISQTLLAAVSALINGQPFHDELPLPHMLRDGTHAVARAIEKTHYVVPGFLREGQSLSTLSR